MRRSTRLSASFCERTNTVGRHGDGYGSFGLALNVRRTSAGRLSKSWVQRIVINGRETNIGLGRYPILTLAEARDKAIENARIIARGGDPRVRPKVVPTVTEAFEATIALRRSGWKSSASEKQWRAEFDARVFGPIGRLPVDKVASGDILKIIAPLWTAKHVTAKRLQGRLSAVMQWAIAEGHRADNPAGDVILQAFPAPKVDKQHMASIHHGEIGAVVKRIREADKWWALKAALEFVILTAARPAEVCGAGWGEIDFDAGVWTVPGERMKGGREHRVPLSDGAMRVLEVARANSDGSGYVFPSARTQKAMHTQLLCRLLQGHLGYGETVHGFRSTFRDWCRETGISREVAEACIAHKVAGVEGAYARSDLLERRRELMAEWSRYIGERTA